MAVLLVVLVAVIGGTVISGQQAPTTYRVVVAGMSCKQQNTAASLECDYRVGRSLHFNIAGVGDKDAGITFLASSFEGDYYATVGVLHGCVIVKPGKARDNPFDVAFVSPRNGKVYQDWGACGDAK